MSAENRGDDSEEAPSRGRETEAVRRKRIETLEQDNERLKESQQHIRDTDTVIRSNAPISHQPEMASAQQSPRSSEDQETLRRQQQFQGRSFDQQLDSNARFQQQLNQNRQEMRTQRRDPLPTRLYAKLEQAGFITFNWLVFLVIVALIIIVTIYFVWPAWSGYWSRIKEEQGGTQAALKYMWENVKEFVSRIVFFQWLNRQAELINAATSGDLYTGKVDQNAKERLGVFIESIGASGTKFYDDEPITVWAELKAKTLDKPVNINVTCSANDLPYDSIYPKTEFNVADEENEDIDCTFYQNKLTPGLKKITFQATFNFQTLSYLKTYLMDRETLRTMNKEGVNINERFGITDTKPVATYTAGPIGVGIEVRDPPIGIDRNQPGKIELPLGIGLLNNWEGEIQKINKLVIMLPLGMDLVPEYETNDPTQQVYCGNYSFKRCSEATAADDVEEECSAADKNNIYILDQSEGKTKLVKDERRAVTDYRNLRCRIGITEENYETVLGNTPLATQYIKVTAGYNYQIKQSKSITIIASQQAQDELQQATCKQTIERKKEVGKVDGGFSQRYIKYQYMTRQAARKNLPEWMDRTEMEALIATVMQASTAVGDTKKGGVDDDKDTVPDYIAGCWEYKDAPTTHRDNTEVDISCASADLDSYLVGHKKDIVGALRNYFYGDGISVQRVSTLEKRGVTLPTEEEMMITYHQWLNTLCVEKKDASAEAQAEVFVIEPAPAPPMVTATSASFSFGGPDTEETIYYRETRGETFTSKSEGDDAGTGVNLIFLKPNTEYEYYYIEKEVAGQKRTFRYPASGTLSFTTEDQNIPG